MPGLDANLLARFRRPSHEARRSVEKAELLQCLNEMAHAVFILFGTSPLQSNFMCLQKTYTNSWEKSKTSVPGD